MADDDQMPPVDTTDYSDNGISARWIGLPDQPLTAGASGDQPGVADHFNLKTGGALDLTKMPSQIAPLDQTSAYRLGQAVGLGDTQPLPTAPLDKPMPDVPPENLTPDARYDFIRQIQAPDNGVDSPQDYAEQSIAKMWRDATWNQPANWDDWAGPLTNAVKARAAAPPEDIEATTVAAQIAKDTGQPLDPATIGGIRGNVYDAYASTGLSPMEQLRRANVDSDIQLALAVPRLQPTNYPTPEEVSVPDDQKQHVVVGKDLVSKLLSDTFLQIVGGMKPENYMAAASHITGADVKHYYDVDLQPGEKLEQSGQTVAENKAEPPTVHDVAQFVATHLLNGPPAEASGALGSGPSYGALVRSLFHNISLDDARAISADREAGAANIRASQGQRNFEQAMAKQALDGFWKTVEPMVPGYQKWIKEFQEYNRGVAQQKDAWLAQGGDPAAFKPTGTMPEYHPLQALYDTMENRQGGARLDPSSPLYPLGEEIKSLMEDRRAKLAEDVSDTMHFWDDYYPHNWLDPKIKVEQAFDRPFGTNKNGNAFHLRERELPTVFDGIQRGLTPRFPNPIEGALHYIQQIDDYRMTERVKAHAIDYDGAYYGRSAQNIGDRPLKNGAGEPITRNRVFNDAEGNAQAFTERLYAPRGFATVYNNWTGRGIYNWPGAEYIGPLYNKILMAKNASLGMAFGLSAFHPFVMMKQGMASAFGRAFGDIKAAEFDHAFANAGLGALGPGEAGRLIAQKALNVTDRPHSFDSVYMGTAKDATPLERQLKDLYIKSGGVSPSQGRGEPYFASQARNLFTEWSRAGAWGTEGYPLEKAVLTPAAIPATAIKSTARDVARSIGNSTESVRRRVALTVPRLAGAMLENFGRVSDTLMSPIFDVAIPRMKRAAWADDMEQYIRQNPQASEAQLLRAGRQVMDSMDDRFGEMNMDNIFWPKAIKQIANVGTVSMGWEYGTWRAIGRGLEDLTTSPQGQRFTSRARALLGYTIAMGFAASVYQYLKTGSTPFSTGAWNFATPLSRPNDPYSAVQLPGEEKEGVRLYSLFKQAGGDPSRWFGALYNYVGGKAEPVLRDAQAIVHYFDYHGKKTLLEQLYANHQPAMMWKNNPAADIGWFERFMGVHSAPNMVTGAPSASKSSGTARPRSLSPAQENRAIYGDVPKDRSNRSERNNSNRRRNGE